MTAADERDDAPDRSEMSRQWRPVLLAYFLRRVNDHAEAEDLTQEMLVRLLGMDVGELEQPEAYIFRIASNLLADRARRHRAQSQLLEIMRSEEHTSELQPLMRISYAVFCLKKKKQ